jgi:hypothetical protein
LWNLTWPVMGTGQDREPNGTFYFDNEPNQLDQFLINKNMIINEAPIRALPETVEILRFPAPARPATTPDPSPTVAWANRSTLTATPITSPSDSSRRTPDPAEPGALVTIPRKVTPNPGPRQELSGQRMLPPPRVSAWILPSSNDTAGTVAASSDGRPSCGTHAVADRSTDGRRRVR